MLKFRSGHESTTLLFPNDLLQGRISSSLLGMIQLCPESRWLGGWTTV